MVSGFQTCDTADWKSALQFQRAFAYFMFGLGLACAITLSAVAADDWRPPQPSGDDEFDWIQLKSGEWLKGKLKSVQEEKLEFDSEELNLLTFDWKDIRTVRSPRLNSVRIEKIKPVDGSVFVTTNEVQVITATATNTYPRADLIAITPTGNRELDKWTGKISAGVSFRSGNTREADINTHASLERRTPDTRLSLD